MTNGPSVFHKGQEVMIYQKPFSEEDREGRAVLVKLLNPDHGFQMERWEVRFDNEPGQTFPRAIRKPVDGSQNG